ncbi:hypothetical protein [Paenibacillus sp. WC2504]|uniref:hypothetical protein n=1 Tax=Paenibacillus sp. WC2504 TaxID=3461403 RepID=UPI004045B38F
MTAFVRRPSDLAQHPRLNIVIGRILEDDEHLRASMAGYDSVFSSLGTGLFIKGGGGLK